jgi:shikimate dehydrogenase
MSLSDIPRACVMGHPIARSRSQRRQVRGHRVVDGLEMLLHQAVPGFERWFGARPVVTAELRRLIEDDIRAS